MIIAQNENTIETRIVSIINNAGLSNQAKHLQDQLQPISNALNTLQSDHLGIADSCNCCLKLLYDELLSPYKEKVTMTLFHFLAFCLHPKYRGRGLDREQLESAHQLVSSKWHGILTCAHSRLSQSRFHNICSMRIFSKK